MADNVVFFRGCDDRLVDRMIDREAFAGARRSGMHGHLLMQGAAAFQDRGLSCADGRAARRGQPFKTTDHLEQLLDIVGGQGSTRAPRPGSSTNPSVARSFTRLAQRRAGHIEDPEQRRLCRQGRQQRFLLQ